MAISVLGCEADLGCVAGPVKLQFPQALIDQINQCHATDAFT
jgi:hypothetical protein